MIQKREIFPRVPLYYSVPMLFICIIALLILVFIFRVEYPVLLLSPSNAINVSACGVLNQSGAYYILNQSIIATTSPCLSINASNVILDGNFKSMKENPLSIAQMFEVSGNNVSLINLNLTYSTLGVVSYGNKTSVLDSYFNSTEQPGSIAINLGLGRESTIRRNDIFGFTFGILLSTSDYSFIEHNKISNLPNALYQPHGIYSNYNNYSSILNNSINLTDYGIILDNSYHSTVSNNVISGPLLKGISSLSSDLNIISDNIILNPRQIGISFSYPQDRLALSTELRNVSVLNGNSSSYDLDINSLDILHYSGVSSRVIINLTGGYFASYIFNNTYLTLSDSLNRSNLQFTENLSTSGANFTDSIKLGYNYAEVKSNLNPGLNKSAIINFFGLPTDLVNGTMYRNGLLCPAGMCINHTSMSAGNVSFTVMGWTNYSVGEGSVNPSISINEPSINELYFPYDFPVVFRVALNLNGSVKFSLNNGSTNVTMNTSNSRDFNYTQGSLSLGNYTFIAYANLSTGQNLTSSVIFRVVNPSINQSLSINEPDPNEQYTTAAFPVTFRVILSILNGSVKFSFNNGLTNTTMINDSSGVEFEYVQNSLDAGNYTFTAFANFTNGTRLKDSVNFSVVNTTGSSTGGPTGGSNSGGSSSGGSSSGGTTTGTTGNGTTSGGTTGSGFGTTSGTGSTQTLPGNQSSSTALRSMIFWLIVAVISVMIIILTILIVKAVRQRKNNLSSGVSVSNPVGSIGLISNLR